MDELKKKLEEKEAELKEMHKSDSTSACVNQHPSGSYLQREMKIEELEDEIEDLKKKINSSS